MRSQSLLNSLAWTALILAAGCATRESEKLRLTTQQALSAGQYPRAVSAVNDLYDCHRANEPARLDASPSSSESLEDKHLLLWTMERGTIAYHQNDWPTAQRFFMQASQLAEQRRSGNFGRSAVAATVANETVREYDGWLYEHTCADYYRALSFLIQAEIADQRWRPPSPQTAKTELPVDKLYEAAVNMARGLTNAALKWVADHSDNSDRYRDDPFARAMAGAMAMALPPAQTLDLDRQFSLVALTQAVKAYPEAIRKFSDERREWHYDVARMPQAFATLRWRALAAYDPARFREEAGQAGGVEVVSRQHLLPKGQGSVLVVDHVGFVPRLETLEIWATMARDFTRDQPTKEERAQGITTHNWQMGAFIFWAKGPGAERIPHIFAACPLPSGLAQLLSPGGITVVGFCLPVYARDRSRPHGGHVELDGAPNKPGREVALEPATDLDAIARSTLDDNQVGIVSRTLLRVIGKQLPGVIAARAANKKSPLLGAVVGTLSSLGVSLTEAADTRSWVTLPGMIRVALIDLPAGPHTLSVAGADGRRDLGTVEVPDQGLIIVPAHRHRHPIP